MINVFFSAAPPRRRATDTAGADGRFRLVLPLPDKPPETTEEAEKGRDAVSRAPELEAMFASTRSGLGGIPEEEDVYFPRSDTPHPGVSAGTTSFGGHESSPGQWTTPPPVPPRPRPFDDSMYT